MEIVGTGLHLFCCRAWELPYHLILWLHQKLLPTEVGCRIKGWYYQLANCSIVFSHLFYYFGPLDYF